MYLRLSVFDLDHTLLAANSSYRFGAYLYHQKFFNISTLLYCLSCYLRHKCFGMSMRSLHYKIFLSLFQGQAIQEIQQYVNHFLSKELDAMLYEPAIRRLREAQQQGHYTIILSSSPDFLVQPIAAHLGTHSWKASLYMRDQEGRLNGISQIIEGQDKADHVNTLAQRLKIAPSSITVYSDSYLDLPVLEMAGKAIGVVPDRHLRKICLANGWEILDEKNIKHP